ncbi:ribosomal protein S5 domain 2-type protein [Chytriomyces cf. hyalinus JEL632]|nr:ribosomal protein S5 domain 2-type protein [Chytriomyces cf. hyalinus JEL632]
MSSSSDSQEKVPHMRAPYEDGSERHQKLLQSFKARFGVDASFVARSPGRVNIIGEHIDYCGFSVLPMAVDRDVLIAVAAKTVENGHAPKVVLTNVDPQKYNDASFEYATDSIVDIDATKHAWHNYFKCGYKGILEDIGKVPPHLDIMIDGNVPAGAGLSSSSAFVCASALSVAYACGVTPNKRDLTETAIRAERYSGVQTGGMDQSISIMATPSSALLIDFYPSLNATPVLIPPHTRPYKFVVANSLVTSEKHVTAARNYNLRVLETRLAARLLGAWVSAKGSANDSAAVSRAKTLREVLDLFLDSQATGLAAGFNGARQGSRAEFINGLRNLEAVAELVFKDGVYSCDDAVTALQEKYKGEYAAGWVDVEQEFCAGIGGVYLDGGLDLKKRVRHVLSEARRVLEFVEVCGGSGEADVLESLGSLMNASQKSCSEDFNCSCPELDELTALCLASGAVGSRLTGAGWGGCTVSLVPEELVEDFIAKVVEGYYAKHGHDVKDVGDWIFATIPGSGALIFE